MNIGLIRITAGTMFCIASAGCIVTRESLDAIASQNPVEVGIVKSTKKTLNTPFPVEKLYGRWVGGNQSQQIFWKHDGGWKRFACDNFRYVFEFFPDGKYSYKCWTNGKQTVSHTGEWKYEINENNVGDIVLNGLNLAYRSVFWISEDEIALTDFRNGDSAVKFRLGNYTKEQYPKDSWNSWCDYKRDECLNELWVSHHISANQYAGYRREWHASATILRRTGDVSVLSPQLPKDATSPSSGTSVSPGLQAESLYNILSCERESGSDFSYRFTLELTSKDKSLRAFRAIQKEFRQAVKEDYTESFPGARQNDLHVDFPEYKLNNGKIEGRAVVLTISVSSLAYDPNTRTGKLAVKVNANQYEEARKWVRKNIETLARDKNIALTTGEIPPAAKFYLGREELKDGNILEIEFKTE